MPLHRDYPACLRRSDAGGHVQTRTADTVEKYRRRIAGIARRSRLQDAGVPLCPADEAAAIVREIGRRSLTLRPAALRQYHAAVRQHLRDLFDATAISSERIEELDALLCDQLRNRTAALRSQSRSRGHVRAKKLPAPVLSLLAAALLRRPTAIRQIAAGLIAFGVLLGTRPIEFLTLRETGSDEFFVTSAKFSVSNRRGLAPIRRVPTDDFDEREKALLRTVIALIGRERAAGATLESMQRRCQRAIRLARAAAATKVNVTCYSARHQARANMCASGMSPVDVAVVLGHASDRTAQTHYASARSAWRGPPRAPLAVDPDLAGQVRVHPRGWANTLERGFAP